MVSEKEKRFAEEVRSSNVFEFSIPEGYNEHLKKIKREKLSVATRAGDTVVYVTYPEKKGTKQPVHIYVHGGGFVRGHNDKDDYYCAKLAHLTNNIIIDIDYRLAPEYKFPISLREIYDVTKWVYENIHELGGDPENITMSGYSAGGNLICAANMLVSDTKEFRVRKQILCYPAVDLFTDPADKPQLPPEYPTIPAERGRKFNLLYTGGKEISASPYVSPLYASEKVLRNLPETFIISAGRDDLKFEAEDFEKRLIDCGVKTGIKCFEDSCHGFIINCMDEWQEAQEQVIELIKK